MSSDPTGRRTNSGAVAPNEESKRTTAGTVSEDSASNRNAVPRTSPHLDFQPPLSQGRRSPLFRSYNAASGRDTSTAAVASRTRPKQTQSCESTPSRGNLSQPPTTFGSARRSHRKDPNTHNARKSTGSAPGNMDGQHHFPARDPFGTDLEHGYFWDGPVGSFGENESPLRPNGSSSSDDVKSNSLAPSPRASPPYQGYTFSYSHEPFGYRRHGSSTPHSSRGRGLQQHHQLLQTYASGHTGPYYDIPAAMEWMGSPQRDDAFAASSTAASPPRPSTSSSTNTTPEKPRPNPFRSPFMNRPARSPNRSPLHASPANLGLTGSFGMLGSPDPHLDPFSPVAPPFNYFDNATDSSRPKLRLAMSDSGESDYMSPEHPSNSTEQSPYMGFPQEYHGLSKRENLEGVARSPLQTGSDRRNRRAAEAQPMSPPRSNTRPMIGRTLRASPMVTSSTTASSEVKPMKLWQDQPPPHSVTKPGSTPTSSSANRNAMRVQIGQTGFRSSSGSTKMSLEGINSVMRSYAPASTPKPTQNHPENTPCPPYSHSRHPVSHYGVPPPPPPGYSHHPHDRFSPSDRHLHPGYAHGYPRLNPSGATGIAKGNAPLAGSYHSSAVQAEYKKNTVVMDGDKGATKTHGLGVRLPCHCRKSKCLKLYCECFSASIYCHGCKCVDCRNTPAYDDLREKAIKEARSKNPTAFQQATVGCRCKKSACLKKYCECFQARELCGSKCKCVDCENRAGSQKLIDKRRKMKDTKGIEFAVRISQEVWKSQNSVPSKPVSEPRQHVAVATPSSSRSEAAVSSHQRMYSHNRPPHPPVHGYMHPGYMGPPVMAHLGYSPMGVPPVTPLYGQYHHPMEVHQHPSKETPSQVKQTVSDKGKKRSLDDISLVMTNTRPVPVRIEFDNDSARKKTVDGDEAKEPIRYFGATNPSLPRTVVVGIFRFLSNKEFARAGLVDKAWNKLAKENTV